MTVDVTWLALLVSTILPFLVAVVTREITSSGVKGILLAVLSAAAAAGQAAINGNGVFDEATLQLAVQTFIISVGIYFGLTKGLVNATARVTDEKVGGLTILAKKGAE